MKLFENGVGRPSNETLKKRRIFIASVIIAIVAVIFVGVYALNGLNLSNLTGEARKVDVSQEYPYKEGSRIYLDNVKVYLTSKVKLLYSKKTGTYYVSSNKLENGRISITKDEKNVGNSKKIAGWITESDLIASKIAENDSEEQETLTGDVDLNGEISSIDASLIQKYVAGLMELTEEQLVFADVNGDGEVTLVDSKLILSSLASVTKTNKVTSTKKTTTYKLKKGDAITLEDAKVYKNSLTNKVKSTESGTFYIYSTIKINNRIKIASEKNGKSIGWVKVNDIKVPSNDNEKEPVKTTIVYQKYSEGDILTLSKTVTPDTSGKTDEANDQVNFSKPLDDSTNIQDYTVINNSSERESTVKIEDKLGNTYVVAKLSIAEAYTLSKQGRNITLTYYDSYEEAENSANEGVTVHRLVKQSSNK